MDSDELSCVSGSRQRRFSNASQQSQQSSKQIFPLTSSDSGLYTCSSNTSDSSLPLESDTDPFFYNSKIKGFGNEPLQIALQDVRKLRSELERLTKSEQWYKQELKQQKSIRLDDLERIYTQERKFMQENQRLQKECVRLYEKCNELERELEKQYQESHEYHVQQVTEDENYEENVLELEKEQHLSLIKDQQQLISVLRKQKRSLLADLKSLTEEKDDKVMELQRILADLEFDNKLITKKCLHFAKERLNLENNLKESDNKLSLVQQEKMNLQKSIIDLKEQLTIQRQLLHIKETEIEQLQQHYTNKIQHEQDLDQVHELSMKYQTEINARTLDIINLKERLQEMQNEFEEMKNVQQQNELQQRAIDQLNFSLKANRLEIQELKISEKDKKKQLDELHSAMDQLIRDKECVYKTTVEQQNDIFRLTQTLKNTQDQYENVQELYKTTRFQLELLELEQGKLKFQNDKDRQEIHHLRNKLKDYLEQTTDLSNKILYMEKELQSLLKENSQLKQEVEHSKKFTNELNKYVEETKKQEVTFQKRDENGIDLPEGFLYHRKSFIEDQKLKETLVDQDFFELLQHCKKLQENLDFLKDNKLCVENQYETIQVQEESDQYSINPNKTEDIEKDMDIKNLCLQGNKLQQNIDKLNIFLKEKLDLLSHINELKNSTNGMEKLVTENEVLKKKLYATESEALTLQIKQDINERTQNYIQIKENLEIHVAKVSKLQKCLVKNDGKLYKLQRKLKTIEEFDEKLRETKDENTKLKQNLAQEQANKEELKKKLVQESEKLKELEQSLKIIKLKQRPTQNQATQCSLTENFMEENLEVKVLKEHVLKLQQDQRHFLEKETSKKEERLQFLHNIMDLQNNKIHNLQHHQKDWEDILISINKAHSSEEKTRKELELKRMELEELNQVFAEQNEELRKLEEFTAILETKRQQEKEQLKITFQQEINVMKQHLQDCQNEIERQKCLNQQLAKSSNRFQNDINEEFITEIAEYKKEIQELTSKISKIMEEKEDLIQKFKDLQNQTKDLKDKKREAVLMPDFGLIKVMDNSVQKSGESLQVSKEIVGNEHFQILTKLLEAEYQRKMLGCDEQIHSLLNSVKCLKKSLKNNEEKTALLSQEQLKTKEELKDLQNTKRSLEEMRLKYEKSQNIIQELKETLAFERKKFELSDLGKSSQNNATTYEVSNLIDDYKKLIQQSAIRTKRPATNSILDLIQRSNQCVPNLQKLETNVEDLRCELQKFLTSYSHKIPATSLIATASLSVPPSLMDELRAASEGY